MAILATPLVNPFIWRKIAIEVGGAIGAYLLDQLVEIGDAKANAANVEWRRLQVHFSRAVPAGFVEDRAVMTFDLINITAGDIDTTWITSDYTSVESAFDTWWTSVKPYVHSSHSLVEFRWYAMRFSDVNSPKPFLPSGPPVRVTSRAVPGTYTTTGAPYQVAATVTEKTAFPKHWGRFYVPGVGAGNFSSMGRFTSAFTTALANATQTFYNAIIAGPGTYPVVPVTQVDKVPARALMAVEAVQVDDVPDVVRSRRPKQASERQIRNT